MMKAQCGELPAVGFCCVVLCKGLHEKRSVKWFILEQEKQPSDSKELQCFRKEVAFAVSPDSSGPQAGSAFGY